MAKRVEPVKKSTGDILADLRAGYREASIVGPEAALKYLDRTFEGQASLPNGVKCVGYDLTAEACGQLAKWERCAEAADRCLSLLPELEAALGHGYRAALEGLTSFERGIQAHGELGDFHRALEICDQAVSLGLGAHFEAKRDSLDWAR
ncbi:MAG TPA: hypothetical protein VJ600_03655 [Holophagaceae bacterium]|nr:hypothetical protein [Holophagaceae bacterium]